MEGATQKLHQRRYPLFLKRTTEVCSREVTKEKGGTRPPFLKSFSYFEYTKWPRRFCCQHCSLCSVQNGFSLP